MKTIHNFSNYTISKTGEVFNKHGKKLALHYKNGYIFVKLNDDSGTRRFIGVHRLLAMTYLYMDGCEHLEVNHKNKIRNDNRLQNLEWITHTQNVRYSRATPLKVIHDDGKVQLFSHVSDFQKKYGWKSGNVHKYIRDYNSYSKKWKLKFELLKPHSSNETM